jgi:gamma-glutamyltranspeptidase/glutathione hydrolase
MTNKLYASPEAALAYARAIRKSYGERLTHMGHDAALPPSAGIDPGCTSNMCVVDAHGNMVALTNTLLSRFGSKVTLPSLGLLMNNAIMWFDPRPGQPNSMAPGVKPLANMCPLLMWNGERRYAMGAAGGRTIFPTLTQLVSYIADLGMSLEEAFTTPRLDASSSTIKVNTRAGADIVRKVQSEFRVVEVEDSVYPVYFSIPTAVCRELEAKLNRGMAHHNTPWACVEEGR